jgi:hypothetical protein
MHVLVHLGVGALALLRVEHIPEEAEPLVKEAAVGHGCRDVGGGQVVRPFLVLLGIGIHGVAEAVAQDVAVLIAKLASAFLVDLDVRVGLEHGACGVEHAIADEVFVDIGVEEGASGVIQWHGVLRWLLLLWRPWLGRKAAIIHHVHRGPDRAAHVHVGHARHVVHGCGGVPAMRGARAMMSNFNKGRVSRWKCRARAKDVADGDAAMGWARFATR